MNKFGMCFSRDFEGTSPLSHIGKKLPVYLRLLEFCQKKGWEIYILTRKTYTGGNNFSGAWLFQNGKFKRIEKDIKIDLVFDWVGNLLFPPKQDKGLKVVNIREFKELTCDKWKAYRVLRDYMPRTIWVGALENAGKNLSRIKSDKIVLKPHDGLRGKGIFIGSRRDLKNFKPEKRGQKYILQEFVETSNGIPGLTSGRHDLRIVIVNGEVVWCHVRNPVPGAYLANVAQGGNITEVDYSEVPASVKRIVKSISRKFYIDYDNPIFSLDFGLGPIGQPLIFEINDQIGFPRWEMKNRDTFLNALVKNFSSKM